MMEEDPMDRVFLDLQKRVADARQALIDHVAGEPGREWTFRELMEALLDHGCRPPVASIAILDQLKHGALEEIGHSMRMRVAQKPRAQLAL